MSRLRAVRPWLSRRPEMREVWENTLLIRLQEAAHRGRHLCQLRRRPPRKLQGMSAFSEARTTGNRHRAPRLQTATRAVVPGKSYATCATTNRPATTQPRQSRAPATGDMQSAGLINEVIGSFANLADELKKLGPVFDKLSLILDVVNKLSRNV